MIWSRGKFSIHVRKEKNSKCNGGKFVEKKFFFLLSLVYLEGLLDEEEKKRKRREKKSIQYSHPLHNNVQLSFPMNE